MPDYVSLIPPDALMAAHRASRTVAEVSAIDIDTLLYRVTGPVSLMLLAIICYFLKRLVDSLDRVVRTQAEMKTVQEVEKEKLHAHVTDDGVHCRVGRCPSGN